MEKRRPTYNLNAFKAAMVARLSITHGAAQDARALGFVVADIIATIKTLDRKHFVKSMTSHGNSKEWQDVYHVPAKGFLIYTKFRADAVTEFHILSFKEK